MTPAPPVERRGPLLMLLAAVVLVLAPTLRAPLFLDDFAHLLLIQQAEPGLAKLHYNTYGVTALPADQVRSVLPWWTSDDFEFNYFRPASTLLLAADFHLWGRESWGYHLTSLVAHLIAVAMLHRLLATLGTSWRGSVTGAAIFALHPGNLAAVYWVSNRSDLVALSLAIASLFAYRAAGRSAGARRWALHASAALALLAGVLTKEMVCAMPVLFILHDVLGLDSRDRADRGRHAWRDWRWVRALPFLAFSAAYGSWYVSRGFGLRSGYAPVTLGIDPVAKLGFMAKSGVLAVGSLLTYVPATVRRHERLLTTPSWQLAVVFLAIVAGAIAIALRPRASRNLRLFALGWTGLFLTPTLGFLPSARYLYVASAGWALLAGSLTDQLFSAAGTRTKRLILASLLGAYAFALPAAGSLWLTSRFEHEFRTAFEGLVESYRITIGPVRADDVILLVNTPSRTTASLVGAAFQFLDAGVPVRVWVLTNFAEVPDIRVEDEHTLLVSAPVGHRFFESPVDSIYLTSHAFQVGAVFHTADFDATVSAMEGAAVTAVRFRMNRPLSDPSLVPICFQGPESVLHRCSFPPAPAGNGDAGNSGAWRQRDFRYQPTTAESQS